MADLFDALNSLFPEGEGSSYKCEDCSKPNGSIKLNCACGFSLEACAKCFADNRSEVLSAVGQHAGECEQGRHLLRCLA